MDAPQPYVGVNFCQRSPEMFISRDREAGAILGMRKPGLGRFVAQVYQAEKPVGEAGRSLDRCVLRPTSSAATRPRELP